MKIIQVFFLFLITSCVVAEEQSKVSIVGRYAISGEWRLDAQTGEVEKLSVIYDRQSRELAKQIQKTLHAGERVVSVEGYPVINRYPTTLPIRVFSVVRPENQPATKADIYNLRSMILHTK